MRRISRALTLFIVLFMAIFAASSSVSAADDDNILKHLHKVTKIASTLPGNMDMNPYGMAEVQRSAGDLIEGHV